MRKGNGRFNLFLPIEDCAKTKQLSVPARRQVPSLVCDALANCGTLCFLPISVELLFPPHSWYPAHVRFNAC